VYYLSRGENMRRQTQNKTKKKRKDGSRKYYITMDFWYKTTGKRDTAY
jgi:hypothetical protein